MLDIITRNIPDVLGHGNVSITLSWQDVQVSNVAPAKRAGLHFSGGKFDLAANEAEARHAPLEAGQGVLTGFRHADFESVLNLGSGGAVEVRVCITRRRHATHLRDTNSRMVI
jgi:hypothetical protein